MMMLKTSAKLNLFVETRVQILNMTKSICNGVFEMIIDIAYKPNDEIEEYDEYVPIFILVEFDD